MSEFYDFCRDLPWLAFILICAAYYTVSHVIRAINIGLRGWPPDHLDADGDHKGRKDDQGE